MLAGLSLGLCLTSAAVYRMRPGALSQVTLAPPWVWAALGLVLAVASHRRGSRRRTGLVGLAWLLFVCAFVEEPAALWTQFRQWPTARWLEASEEGRGLRVISLNCMGQDFPVQEALAYGPDLLLLQEVPGTIWQVPRKHPAYRLTPGSPAILARGALREVELPPNDASHLRVARVAVAGQHFIAASVHLSPQHQGKDVTKPENWRTASESYSQRAAQAQALADTLDRISPSAPVIIGGDFNSTAGDSVLAPLRQRYADSFSAAGIGLGNTVRPWLRLLRVDYIWLDRSLQAEAVVTRSVPGTDHCMVICDLTIPHSSR